MADKKITPKDPTTSKAKTSDKAPAEAERKSQSFRFGSRKTGRKSSGFRYGG